MATAKDLLDLAPGIGTRADTFVFELVDENRVHTGLLSVSEDSVPNVQVDTSRTVMRLLNNVEVVASDLSEIDIFHDRLRVKMRLQSGDEYPLGIFMFGQQNNMPHSWGSRYTPQLFDEAFLLNQRLPHTHTVKKGGSCLVKFLELVAEVPAIPSLSLAGVADVAAGSPLVYQVGTLRYDALKALAQVLGCYPPYFANDGTFMLRPIPPAGSGLADHTYGLGGRIFEDTTTIISDAYTAPNQWIVVSDAPAGAIVGVYNLPASSPASSFWTGRIVTADVVSVQGLPDTARANDTARFVALLDKTVYDKATFQSAADPRHDIFDTVALLGVRYIETGWQIECSSGGPMGHLLSKIYD